ncbi:MAG: hypothetical protein ACE5JG_01365 [Planctomycetota bacterium]
MREIGAAVAACARAPWTHWRLSLLVWGALVVPVLLGFSLPLLGAAEQATAHHPDAPLLLQASKDRSGFAYAFGEDFVRNDFTAIGERLFWVLVGAWLLTAFLSGGVVSRLVRPGESRPLLLECGRLVWRFVRLGVLAAFLVYLADLAVNQLWAARLADAVREEHSESLRIAGQLGRGAAFLALWYLLRVLHAYARILLVARDGRSVVAAYLRGLGRLVTRCHRLVPLELALVALNALLLLVGLVVLRALLPAGPDVGWLAIALFLGAAAFFSYLRSAITVGFMVARCRYLAPLPATATPRTERKVEREAADFFDIGGPAPPSARPQLEPPPGRRPPPAPPGAKPPPAGDSGEGGEP